MNQALHTHKVEQLILATAGLFWCFLMWFSTAAFSPSIAAHYRLGVAALGVLASSAMWMAPVGRVIAGWAADRFGAPRAFALVLAICGIVSIASACTSSYPLLFAERVVVAAAGVAFVIGIQHVAQWFEPHEIGTAEGLYAGTGNAGAGVGALWTPLPFIARTLPYAPRLHWLGIALVLITLAMLGLAAAGLSGSLHASVAMLVVLGTFISFGTGGTFALVPLLFPDRPGVAAGFIGGLSTAGGLFYPLVFAGSSNINTGYLEVALLLFVPFVAFYYRAASHEIGRAHV